jgi:CRISPR-associated protein Cmr2
LSKVFWQAKIWGILHEPVYKALHNNTGRSSNSFWAQLPVMQDWVENNWNPEESQDKFFKHIKLADYIASASDRGAIGSITKSVNYNNDGLEISHLLSGAKFNFVLKEHQELVSNNNQYLNNKEQELLNLIPETIRDKDNEKQLFWWLWRCLPEAGCRQCEDDSLMLMPAETRLPDSSIWSHASITAALAGALAGYDINTEDLNRWTANKELSHPYLAAFSFTPVQELIKASRKMRDFWAGSWILHYLAAKICFKLALKYGPDSVLYPSLFQQPLIDHWLLQKFPEFSQWVEKPKVRTLLTAGFPNVIVVILPKDKVKAAMVMAEEELKLAWGELGDEVFDYLQEHRRKEPWMKGLEKDSKTWRGWLKSQWQFYWTSVPIGKEGESLKSSAILKGEEEKFQPWLDKQNIAYSSQLYKKEEFAFLQEASQKRFETQKPEFSANVGSWWPNIFDQTRYALAAVKNARNWEIPTAFAPRSTISGVGPVVHPGNDWVKEAETKKYWERHAGLFDGREQLNATETVKRGLEKILPRLLNIDNENEDISASYPDLTAGVAGYLKFAEEAEDSEHWRNFQLACDAVMEKFPWTGEVLKDMRSKWGIPWMDDDKSPKRYHPRLLNAGWLVEDAETDELKELEKQLKNEDDEEVKAVIRKQIHRLKLQYRTEIQKIIDKFYPNNNPADWYVLAAGDGDGMSEWLKGKKLEKYRNYVPQTILDIGANNPVFNAFLDVDKRMGPSTHNALSRALLDFSNQLVPYLTEQRYAGRLIYAGGDDILAYTNLWEWHKWLWDIRQCFRGDKDPRDEFDNPGDYWKSKNPPNKSTDNPSATSVSKASVAKRPLFTMGKKATISFGVIISHHSVPLAIALENLWESEAEAKEHISPNGDKKDAVQVRVLYGNGNILKSTAKFDIFHQWQKLIHDSPGLDASIFEQAATLWNQHPIPHQDAIKPWMQIFCDRRDLFKTDDTLKQQFLTNFTNFLKSLWETTPEADLTLEVQNWLKLAALTIRNTNIQLGGIV